MARLEDGGKLIDGGRIRSKERGIIGIFSGGVRDGPGPSFESGQIFTGR